MKTVKPNSEDVCEDSEEEMMSSDDDEEAPRDGGLEWDNSSY